MTNILLVIFFITWHTYLRTLVNLHEILGQENGVDCRKKKLVITNMYKYPMYLYKDMYITYN